MMSAIIIAIGAISILSLTWYSKEMQIEAITVNHKRTLSQLEETIGTLTAESNKKDLDALNLSYTISLKEQEVQKLQERIGIDNVTLSLKDQEIRRLQERIIINNITISKLEAQIAELRERINVDNLTISKLESQVASLTQETENLRKNLTETIEIAKQYHSELQNIRDVVKEKNVEIEELRSQVHLLKQPCLLLVDLRVNDYKQFWFWDPPTHLHVQGYIVNINEERANTQASWKLHITAMSPEGNILIDNRQVLPTIEGNGWIHVEYDVYYSDIAKLVSYEARLECGTKQQ